MKKPPYNNLTTQPFSAEGLRKTMEKLKKQKPCLGEPVEPKINGKWIKPFFVSHEDFHNLINAAYPKLK